MAWKLTISFSCIAIWLGLDCQSSLKNLFGLDWLSEKIGLSNTLNVRKENVEKHLFLKK